VARLIFELRYSRSSKDTLVGLQTKRAFTLPTTSREEKGAMETNGLKG
jgi:hypothetical protein